MHIYKLLKNCVITATNTNLKDKYKVLNFGPPFGSGSRSRSKIGSRNRSRDVPGTLSVALRATILPPFAGQN